MRVHRITIVSLLVLALASVASAQAKPPAGAPAPAPAPTATAVKARPASTEDLVAQGDAVVRRGNAESQSVRNMLDEARKEADIIKITCLDDKLTQIDVNLRTAETRLDALRKAVDPDRRIHEYTVLTVLGQKLQVLDQEAHQCVGQAMYETGVTKVVTEIDTRMMPSEDTSFSLPVITPGATVPATPPIVSAQK